MDMSMIVVARDLGVVAQTCDRVVVMYGGVVAEQGLVAEVFASPSHPYTQLLLEAFPDMDHPDRPLVAIPGARPPHRAAPGCRFAPRCPFVFDRCRTEQPPLYWAGEESAASCFLLEAPLQPVGEVTMSERQPVLEVEDIRGPIRRKSPDVRRPPPAPRPCGRRRRSELLRGSWRGPGRGRRVGVRQDHDGEPDTRADPADEGRVLLPATTSPCSTRTQCGPSGEDCR